MSTREQLNQYLVSLEKRLRLLVVSKGMAIAIGVALGATIALVLITNALAFSDTSVAVARVVLFVSLAVALGTLGVGCKVGPNFQPPKRLMPASWLPPTTAPTTQNASVTTPQPADVAMWWGRFNDPVLDSLISRAMESSLELKWEVAVIPA